MVIANKGSGRPLTMITAYDATFARIVDESGVDMILVGDRGDLSLQNGRLHLMVEEVSLSR